jgi:hypothetical protein
VDYSLDPPAVPNDVGTKEFEQIIRQLSGELRLDLELVPLAEFIPLPPDSEKRHRFWGRYGQLDVYIFDLYSIALSKIARGFESDLEDVEFLLGRDLIAWDELEAHFMSILPYTKKADIDPQEFQTYFDTLKKRLDSISLKSVAGKHFKNLQGSLKGKGGLKALLDGRREDRDKK